MDVLNQFRRIGMFTVEQKIAMGIIMFAVVKHTVTYDERKNLITRKETLEAFFSEAAANQALLAYN